ncbi:MAG TPA: FAD-dependent monooxygenase [Xanthobacteraceae bacterium]|jgi:2-polyprenyl-6-methoxyphenol hydroxylase-like FAD-dependent oxidoreductase
MARRNGRRALIVGGSMSGLLAGLMLRERGWDVEIIERVESELAGRGAGIVAQPELIEILRALRLDTRDLGVEIQTRQLIGSDGRVAGRLDCPQTLTAWERVYRVLRDGYAPGHYRRGIGLRSFTQSEHSVVAQLSDGGTAEADLMIGADGLRSTVRQACLPDLAPLYAGYVAWRSLLGEDAIPPELFDYMTFCLPPGEQFLGYAVAGPDNDLRPGHRRYNVVWYRPAEEATELKRLLTDESGMLHAISIPPPLIRRAAIADMRAAAERLLGPQLRAIVDLMTEPILQPIYDLESPHMAFGRVAVIGDAAFVARPHVAAGVSKAAKDAAVLAEALDATDDVAAALRQFEAKRLPVNTRIIERARHLGAYLQATQTAEERTRSQQHGIPEAVMAETAVLDFLYA